jgi:hypothetical protein
MDWKETILKLWPRVLWFLCAVLLLFLPVVLLVIAEAADQPATPLIESIIRYHDVLFRWPVTVLVLGVVTLVAFRVPLSDLIERIKEIKTRQLALRLADGQSQTPPVGQPEIAELAPVVEGGPQASAEHVTSSTPQVAPHEPGGREIPRSVINYIQQHAESVAVEFARVFNGYRYEKAFNLIFGTQLDLLWHLMGKGESGEAYTNLFVYYDETLRREPRLKIQMADYIDFLLRASFVQYIGDGAQRRVRITPIGSDFLSYIRTVYPTSWYMKPL